ncbi:MAG: sulfatase, partial [Thermoanaerobaculia bacterium]
MTGRVRAAGGPWLVALALFAAGCGGDEERHEAARQESPSVLLVTLDTTRADHLGAYGSANGATPHLDALAARGIVFERAYAIVPMTLPAHTAMFTGRLPAATGVRWNGDQRLADSPAELPTLAERFRAEGYATAAFVSAAVLDHAFGLDRGFEHYDDAVGAGAAAPTNRWKAERPARQTVEHALDWLAAQPADRPVFLWVHLFEPHDPYLPPAPFAARFADEPYSGEIAAADHALGSLFASSRFRPEARAIVSVIGDHGESLGEHGEATHGILLNEAVLHVPWILAAPDLAPRRIAVAVSQVDLAPTLLARAGLAPLAQLADADGSDIFALDHAAGGGRARTLYAESLYARALYGWAGLYSTRRGDYKWVSGIRGELYDFVGDPGETSDLRAAQPATAGALNRALVEIRGREKPGGGSAAAVDAALAASLQSLGYLAGGAAGPQSAATEDPRDRIALHERLRAVDAQWRRGDFRGAEQAVAELFAADPRNHLLREVVERQVLAFAA